MPARRRSAWIAYEVHATVVNTVGGCRGTPFRAAPAGGSDAFPSVLPRQARLRQHLPVPHVPAGRRRADAGAVLVSHAPGHRVRAAGPRRRRDARHRGVEPRPAVRLGRDTEGEASAGSGGSSRRGTARAPAPRPRSRRHGRGAAAVTSTRGRPRRAPRRRRPNPSPPPASPRTPRSAWPPPAPPAGADRVTEATGPRPSRPAMRRRPRPVRVRPGRVRIARERLGGRGRRPAEADSRSHALL